MKKKLWRIRELNSCPRSPKLIHTNHSTTTPVSFSSPIYTTGQVYYSCITCIHNTCVLWAATAASKNLANGSARKVTPARHQHCALPLRPQPIRSTYVILFHHIKEIACFPYLHYTYSTTSSTHAYSPQRWTRNNKPKHEVSLWEILTHKHYK